MDKHINNHSVLGLQLHLFQKIVKVYMTSGSFGFVLDKVVTVEKLSCSAYL